VLQIYEKFKGFENCGDNELIIQIASIFYKFFKQSSENKGVFEKLIEIVIPINENQKDYSKGYKEIMKLLLSTFLIH
jgi:hypothetical protein